MNGKKQIEIKGMTEGEFRVLLVEKMNTLERSQRECKKDLKENKDYLADLNVKVAKIPPHCIQVAALKEQDKRIDELEKKDAASKAIKSLLIGLMGGVGGSGGVVALLKWVFHVIQ